LLYVLYDARRYRFSSNLRSKNLYETLLEVTKKFDLSDNEQQEAEEYLKKIKD
jgi:hypothetical protein